MNCCILTSKSVLRHYNLSGLFYLFFSLFPAPSPSPFSVFVFIICWQFQGVGCLSPHNTLFPLDFLYLSLTLSLFLSFFLFFPSFSLCRFLVRRPPPCHTASDGPESTVTPITGLACYIVISSKCNVRFSRKPHANWLLSFRDSMI